MKRNGPVDAFHRTSLDGQGLAFTLDRFPGSTSPWIGLSGPSLGPPKSEPVLVAAEKQQFSDDQRQKSALAGKIGQGKRTFGLGLLRENLPAKQD